MQLFAIRSCFVGEVGRSYCQICQRQRPILAGQPQPRGFPAEFRNTSFSVADIAVWRIWPKAADSAFRMFQFPGLPRECRRFSTDIRRSRQMPSPVETLLGVFVRAEGVGHEYRIPRLPLQATLPIAAEAQDSACGTADSTLSASLKTLGSTLHPTLATHPMGHRRCLNLH
jgi:hypothetical protein